MKKLVLLLLTQCVLTASQAQVKVANLLCENLSNPLSLDVPQPRFTWQLLSPARNTMQTAYEIKVSEDRAFKRVLWTSGKLPSGESVHVPYQGNPLQSGKQYYWQVRVWDNHGNNSPWSEVAHLKMGLLNAADWQAKWISPGFVEDSVLRPSPLFRKQFATSKKSGRLSPISRLMDCMKQVSTESALARII